MKVVRYVGNACRSTEYVEFLSRRADVVIDPFPDAGNVGVRFLRQGRPVQMRWQSVARDLFDLALVLYIADELEPRGDAWTRELDLLLPVTAPAAWEATKTELRTLLRFLTGDDCQFRWTQARALSGYGNHRTPLPKGYDTVCLFSGGLDSLVGAVRLLQCDHRVVLVGHYADAVASRAQAELFEMLHARFGNQVELIQCNVSRSRRSSPKFPLPDKREDSHRSRSFLFLALGVAVARAIGVENVVLAENGLIALNPPLGASRCGSLSTRTAHPQFLANFGSFVRSVGAFSGRLENPFLYMSKNDILHGLDDWVRPLILRSVSCAHAATSVRWEGKKGVRHCGYCVPCIYRRLALMEAGLDRARDYCCDVFRDLQDLSPTRQEDLRFLARFARRLVGAGNAELRGLVVSHGYFAADVGTLIGPSGAADYGPWAEMLRKWGSYCVDRIENHSTAGTRRILGMPARSRGMHRSTTGRKRR